jgi:NADH dehydrogenase
MKVFVTGGTGFIGRSLVRKLVEAGHEVRLLVRPSKQSPHVPTGVPVEIAVSSVSDGRGLRSAMAGMEAVVHLAGVERRGAYANLMNVDVQGTRLVAQIGRELGIERILYVSHLGADRYSAYPISKVKGLGEDAIRESGVDYTIFRSAIVFGEGDSFTTGIASLLATIPLFFLVPGDGRSLIQPIWVEDLTTVMAWALDDPQMANKVYEVGGPEMLSFTDVVQMIMDVTRVKRRLLYIGAPYLRGLTVFMETSFPRLPVSVFWLDYLAVNHTCALDTLPRVFSLLPSRLSQRMDYLRKKNWREAFWKAMWGRSVT